MMIRTRFSIETLLKDKKKFSFRLDFKKKFIYNNLTALIFALNDKIKFHYSNRYPYDNRMNAEIIKVFCFHETKLTTIATR